MEAIYSPSSQTLSLFPRFSSSSPSSSSSSSSSISLRVSRITSIRNEFFGFSPKLRHRHRAKCKSAQFDTAAASGTPVALLSSLPIAAVVVAVTFSAFAALYSNFNRSKRKKNESEGSVLPSSDFEQDGRTTSKQVFHSSLGAEDGWNGSLMDKYNSSLNVTEFNSSFEASTSDLEHRTETEKAEVPDTRLHDFGSIASALSEKSDSAAVSLSQLSTKFEDQQQRSLFTEESDVSALIERGEVMPLSLPQEPPKLGDLGPAVLFTEKSESFTSLEGGTVMTAPVELLTEKLDPSPISEGSEVISISLPQAYPDTHALESPVPFMEETEAVNRETDVNIKSPDGAVETNDSMSELVHSTVKKENSSGKSQLVNDKLRASSGRKELHFYYENLSVSDSLTPMQSGLSSKQSLENNKFPVIPRSSSFKTLQKDHSQVAGFGGQGPVVAHAEGSFDKRKHSSKKRGNTQSDMRKPPSHVGFQTSNNVSHILTTQVNGEHAENTHMSSYNRLVRKGRLSECVELLEDMDSKDMLDMDKIYHARFFDMCRRQRAIKEAFRFAKLIPNPTLSTFNMLMSVCSAAQDSEGAFETWQLVQQAGLKADCKLYTTLISTCAKSGKVDTMFEVFHEMVSSGVEPNVHTYGALIDGCARAGQVAKAFGAYGILRSKNVTPDRVVFNALITACGQSGAVERAFDVLAEMRAEIHPIDPDHVTVGALIKACTKAGQVDRVKGVYGMIDQYGIKGTPELYTIAVNSCSQTGDWEFACNIYADMKKNVVIPDEMFFSALIDFAGHAGNLEAAFEVMQDAKDQGMNPGNISYSSLMGACSNTRNWKKALELFEEIKATNLRPTVSTINALITALCDADQMQRALDVLSEMKELGLRPNDVTYSILIAKCEKNDDIEVALELYSQAKAEAVPFSHIMCKCLIKMCSRRFEKVSSFGEAVVSFKSGRPQIDSKWSSLALKIYREMIGSGLIPSMEMLSQVLGCLKLPQDVSLKKRLAETLEINAESSRKANLLPLIEGFAEYDIRAFSLFEEAASLSIVPCVSFKENPIVIDARDLNIHIAKVYILTVLRGLKHRLAAGVRLPSIAVSLPVETAEITFPAGEKAINVSGRMNQAVGALLRRLRLAYQGNESSGKIRITGLAMKRWFQPKLVPSISGKQPQFASFGLNMAKGISNQQRNIRTGNLSLS